MSIAFGFDSKQHVLRRV